jgi:hypothetical protein
MVCNRFRSSRIGFAVALIGLLVGGPGRAEPDAAEPGGALSEPVLHFASAGDAVPGYAVLHVAVHRDAGTLSGVAADGASGQCRPLGTARLACPASGPVTFRWGGERWVLWGAVRDPDPTDGAVLRGAGPAAPGPLVVSPGEVGVAALFPPTGMRDDDRRTLRAAPTPEAVRQLFLRTGDRPIAPATPGLFADLLALTQHEDPLVRREAMRGLMPYVRHTASDPFPADAPSLLPPGFLQRMATDEDPRVRRRNGALLREIGPADTLAGPAETTLRRMLQDAHPSVRRQAIAIWSAHAREGGEDEAVEAWNAALERVPTEGAPGRAACNALAKLADSVDPEAVDVDGAMALVMEHHPERAWRMWKAWREELPFDAGRAGFLFSETVGLSERLIRDWAEDEPDALAAVLVAWEPTEPHSERWGVVRGWLATRTDHPRLREVLALGDRLSNASEPPEVE